MQIADTMKAPIGIALSDEKEITKLINFLSNEEEYKITLTKEKLWEYPILTGTIYVNAEEKTKIIQKLKKMIK